MSKELNNTFVDVRNAFRLLNQYQKRVLHIVDYIREQTLYTDMRGGKWYFDQIKRRNIQDEYNLAVSKDMWGWDFLYGYIFEYYFGKIDLDCGRKVKMSIIQVSDDGFFISDNDKKQMTNVSSFAPSEASHSYVVLIISIYTTKDPTMWFNNKKHQNDNQKEFLTQFLSSYEETRNEKAENGEVAIMKKYEMQRFSSQQSTDEIIREFGKIIRDNSGIKIFRESFY